MKKLQLPESQIQEVLYELINRLSIDRKTMMLSSGVWNLTARIADLRRKGVLVNSNPLVGVNKYGRQIDFVNYSISDKKSAVIIYERMKDNQRKKVCSNPFYDFGDCEVQDKQGCLSCEWFQNR
jgi:hypothetical protein